MLKASAIMTITLSDELETRLRERAAQVGGDAQTLARLLIADGLRALDDGDDEDFDHLHPTFLDRHCIP